MVLSSYQTELIDKLRSERVTVDKTIDWITDLRLFTQRLLYNQLQARGEFIFNWSSFAISADRWSDVNKNPWTRVGSFEYARQ